MWKWSDNSIDLSVASGINTVTADPTDLKLLIIAYTKKYSDCSIKI